MTSTSKPRRSSLPQRLLTKGFQHLWRFSRGHLLYAGVLIWGTGHTLLVTAQGTLPARRVPRGEAAADVIERFLRTSLAIAGDEARLVAMAQPSSDSEPSSHIALFELDWQTASPLPEGMSFVAPEALEGALSPDLLTIVRSRHSARRAGETV